MRIALLLVVLAVTCWGQGTVLGIGGGGTGASTAAGARTNLLQITGTPDGTKYLRDDWTWQAVAGGSGEVSSVFGRTGAVTAQVGDYSGLYALLAHTHLYEVPLTFTAPLARSTNTISITGCEDGELRKWRTATGWTCEADQTGEAGGGITSLGGLTGASQTFATPGTTGTAPNWVSSGTAHTLHIPLASASGVTAGLVTKAWWDTAILTSGSYSDPTWLTLSRTGGQLTGFGGAAALDIGTGSGTVAAGDDGRLSDARTPTAHASSHLSSGADAIAAASTTIRGTVTTTTSTSQVVSTDDSRMSNARTPSAHASTHGSGQADAITVAQSQVTNLTSDLAGKEAGLGNPGTNGYVLSSTTAGVRSWVAPSGGSGGSAAWLIFSMAPSVQVGGSTTTYSPLYGGTTAASTFSTTETTRYVPAACTGTLSNLYLRTVGNQSATGALVLTVRKNGAACGLTITVAAGATSNTFSDTTNSCSIAAGDSLTMELANAATASSANLSGWSMQLACN